MDKASSAVQYSYCDLRFANLGRGAPMPICGNCKQSHPGAKEVRECYQDSGRSVQPRGVRPPRRVKSESKPKVQRTPSGGPGPGGRRQPNRSSGPRSSSTPSNTDSYVSDVRGHRPRGRPTPTTGQFCNACGAEIDIQGLCRCS